MAGHFLSFALRGCADIKHKEAKNALRSPVFQGEVGLPEWLVQQFPSLSAMVRSSKFQKPSSR